MSGDLLVQTAQGAVRGRMRGDVALWCGIPYAEPPEGTRRFLPPRPPLPWRGERDATRFGAVAPQSRDSRVAAMSGITDKTPMSEDCLTLNVYSPAADGARRPVMVWLHGGAFVMGAGSTPLYDGSSFAARHDIVVVTINYRIGLLGFLYLGEIAGEQYAAGNQGLLDQIAALAWVRDNIAAFGGDPDAVTLMGQSAGSISIANLLAAPAARGLFHRAIMQSGASPLFPHTRNHATALARAVLAELGIDASRAASELAAVPLDRLMAAQEVAIQGGGLAAISPYVDGVTVPERPVAIAERCAGANVPLLIGTTRDEWTLFDVFLGPPVSALVREEIAARIGDEALVRVHTGYLAARPDGSAERAWVDLMGDVAFWMPVAFLADAQSACSPVWMYRFDWVTPIFDGRLGATHALDLPFVWNVAHHPHAQFLLGGQAAAVEPLVAAMHDSWAAFIRRGDPNGAGLPDWPGYERGRRATMLLDSTCRVTDDPDRARRELWPV